MRVDLIDIPYVDQDWEVSHEIKALAVNGRAPALDALADWKRDSPGDFKKMLVTLSLVGTYARVMNPNRVKRMAGRGDIYEARGGKARLFLFYTKDADEVVVCTNAYWKTKPSKAEQNEAIERSRRLKALYESIQEGAP